MDRPLQELQRFLQELKRRNVYKVATTYAVVAFVVWQAASLLFPALDFPAWTVDFVIVFTLLGFPLALVLAWAFEMTAEGVRRTPAAEPEEQAEEEPEAAKAGTRTAYELLVGLGLVAAAVAGGWYLTGGGGGDRESTGRSIAVLPFENMGGEESAQLGLGVHDGLLSRLSSVSGLQVTSRTSALRYEDAEKTVPEIARELGARWIVEGSVQQAGGEVQVSAQLIEADDDAQRWAERYNRELNTENLFAIQSELTKKIARSLEAELTTEELEQVERRPTEDLDAYRLYLQGRSHMGQRTEEGTRRAVRYFRRALAQDSSYALAWVGWADVMLTRKGYGYPTLADSLAVDPEDALRRALAIDSTLAEAHASMGLGTGMFDGIDGIRRLQRGVELKPSYARAHHWLGMGLYARGRLEQGVAHLERAAELDPLSPSVHSALAVALYAAGRHEEALREAHRAGELAPEVGAFDHPEVMVLSALGRHEEALAALEAGLERTPEAYPFRSLFRAWRAVIHVRTGDTARPREVLTTPGEAPEHAFARGVVLTALGKTDRALSAFGNAEIAGSWLRSGIFRYDPVLDPVRTEPAYREILRDVNVSHGLNPDGSLPEGVDWSSPRALER